MLPRDVLDELVHGWPPVERGVWSVVVVMVQLVIERRGAFGVAAIHAGVGPLVRHRLVEPFGFAVGLGPVGLGAQVACAQVGQGVVERL